MAREYATGAMKETKNGRGDTVLVPPAPATIRNKLSYLRSASHYAQKHHGMMPATLLTIVRVAFYSGM